VREPIACPFCLIHYHLNRLYVRWSISNFHRENVYELKAEIRYRFSFHNIVPADIMHKKIGMLVTRAEVQVVIMIPIGQHITVFRRPK
jgi:hypothetical protein